MVAQEKLAVLAELRRKAADSGADLVSASSLPSAAAMGVSAGVGREPLRVVPGSVRPEAVVADGARENALAAVSDGGFLGGDEKSVRSGSGVGAAGVRQDVVPLGGAVGGLLPGGGLPRRAVSHVSASSVWLADVLAQCTAAGLFVAVVGWPDFVYAQVADEGDLSRVIVVPDAGKDPLHTVGVLAEGVDVVLFRSARSWQISPTRVRPLLSRVRSGVAAVLFSGATVPSPAVSLDARVSGFHGAGRGVGRIRGVSVSVQVRAKGQPPRVATVDIGHCAQQPAAAAAGLRVIAG
ncbi:hypothetical protein [Corynebacterium aquilae]|uniref:hypothetical protein n=1 Tax=Corynebacterium aquilae TaxID=203263 RepID=UPI0012EE02D4|nr:hypothetical protein [Corynebacterium aquilae]